MCLFCRYDGDGCMVLCAVAWRDVTWFKVVRYLEKQLSDVI